ncbi:MAG: aminotransferase class I/II-fold pyridoxal phosphate-dependent enzyme [bacterium]|nr:aminotransferase class I/II-fold pyridoxal phosphate-dependent enzyme [bacterium]
MKRQRESLRVPYAKAVHDTEEEKRVIRVLREKRTILGRETLEFEKSVAKLFGKKYGVMVNSGSSANLLSVRLIDLPKGSEVITPILTFSTTLTPLLECGLIPVFADVEEGKYTIDLNQAEKLLSSKTKALMIPLLLGNVPDLVRLKRFAKKHSLYVIEDSCDTLGATYFKKPTGYYSDISTTSFYGSHIITAGGGGGMILLDNKVWADRAKTLRGWGRGSAKMGETEDIDSRYSARIDNIKYDAKFIFSDLGYNFLPIELGSAFGNAQLKKLSKFRKTREYNFASLYKFFQKYEKFFILPKQDKSVRTQWLAFPLTIRDNAPFSRFEIVSFLEKENIQTRPIFTGVVTKQPAFKEMHFRSNGKSFPVAQEVMERGFLIGCHHGLEKQHLDKLQKTLKDFLNKFDK